MSGRRTGNRGLRGADWRGVGEAKGVGLVLTTAQYLPWFFMVQYDFDGLLPRPHIGEA